MLAEKLDSGAETIRFLMNDHEILKKIDNIKSNGETANPYDARINTTI